MPAPLLVLDVVGLTPRLLEHMPRLRRIGGEGFVATLDPVLPALTCSAQATMLTGVGPSRHGIVGNGWYFRDLGEILLWRQHHRLIQAEPVWETARRARPGLRAANVCWWYAMGATTDFTVTPRPIYYSDGRKEPDCYADPPTLHDDLTAELGTFPLFHYWGPAAGIRSSRWIARAARSILERERPDLTLVYLPHLDYDLQRFGPDAPRAVAAAREIDELAGGLAEHARERAGAVVVVSEYGITPVSRPVDINRALRRAGLLRVYVQDGMEYLDPWTSRAFAVADHQVAHVYVRDPGDIRVVEELLAQLPGLDLLLDAEGQAEAGLAHERAGELVAIAEADAWFTYYYWLEDGRAPDFARLVEIHRKPGYDPAELFMDPTDRAVKLRAALALARKKSGMRYTMNVVALDPQWVRGSHGRLPADPVDGPLLLCSDAAERRERMGAHEVRNLLLRLLAAGG
ncbi:MAG TPA: alkaline phosphatase family protein [Solirubrobacteraceae bacterium]|jgi:predicted AlkP superfamily pyrophosphatase or phosphodiesterase|nr:alkaline phosphatase family protein [Solirubrobacteraceae bacterium]